MSGGDRKQRLRHKDEERTRESQEEGERVLQRETKTKKQTETEGDRAWAEERKEAGPGCPTISEAPTTWSGPPSGTLYWTENPGLEGGTPELGGPTLHLPGCGVSRAQNPSLWHRSTELRLPQLGWDSS